jgi:predicted TIM-barrel fold metal-dependent hydrolase
MPDEPAVPKAAVVPIIDAHVHLWEPSARRYPWIAAGSALDRAFRGSDFQEAVGMAPVAGCIVVEAGVASGQEVAEIEWVVLEGNVPPGLHGIVASAPLERGTEARSFLDSLRRFAPLIKGVRRNLQDEPDPAFCLQPAFVEGVQLLAKFDWAFDLCIRAQHLPAVTALVQRCPDIRFVLDHLGKPPIREHQLDPWRDHLAALAALPNVACKISGMVTEADLADWLPENLALYVAHALAAFGSDRVLFGSDWPVVTLASSYRRWVETLAALTAQLSLEERRKLWGENAQHWYRVTPFVWKT